MESAFEHGYNGNDFDGSNAEQLPAVSRDPSIAKLEVGKTVYAPAKGFYDLPTTSFGDFDGDFSDDHINVDMIHFLESDIRFDKFDYYYELFSKLDGMIVKKSKEEIMEEANKNTSLFVNNVLLSEFKTMASAFDQYLRYVSMIIEKLNIEQQDLEYWPFILKSMIGEPRMYDRVCLRSDLILPVKLMCSICDLILHMILANSAEEEK